MDARRVDWILVERKEEVEKDPRTNEICRATICIFYWELGGGPDSDSPDGEFTGFYDQGFGGVSITSSSLSSGGYVVVDPPRLRGGRLGTYLMNEIVSWAKQWPDTPVCEVTLRSGDAIDLHSRLRRNRFYEGFGLEFDYSDTDKSTGVLRPMLARSLNEVTTWTQTITEYHLLDYLRTAFSAAEDAAITARMQVRTVEELCAELASAERRPIRWVAKSSLRNHPAGVVVAAACILASLYIWFKLL